jgi:hypothetical protein
MNDIVKKFQIFARADAGLRKTRAGSKSAPRELESRKIEARATPD